MLYRLSYLKQIHIVLTIKIKILFASVNYNGIAVQSSKL